MCSCSAENRFDCIVTGGGHAGSEAAVALARLGLSVLLISGNVDRLGYLSCNPAIGGLAKGHMVREIDALGGMMGLWADAGGIQFRTLNMSKGPAVRATRAQIDREAYQKVLKKTLFSTPGLRIWQDSVTEVLEENGHAAGVRTAQGLTFHARHVLLTTGTFLAGLIHIGLTHLPGGRLGDAPATGLSDSLRRLGLTLGRLKTGTTPRLLRASIDFSKLEEQPGDTPPPRFSFRGPGPATSPGPTRPPMRPSVPASTALPCSPGSSRARAPATAPPSRTRWRASPSANGTRSSWSPKAWTARRSMPTASPPACRWTCSRP